jgi:hypothetical protein
VAIITVGRLSPVFKPEQATLRYGLATEAPQYTEIYIIFYLCALRRLCG